MKITICVGSTCHLLGSKRVVDKFKELVSEHHLDDKVELAGKICILLYSLPIVRGLAEMAAELL